MTANPRPLRVRIVQPLIPAYREAVFAEFASRPGIDLEVWADLDAKQGSLKGATGSERFRCVHAPYRERGPFIWQPGVFRAVKRPCDAVILPWNSRYAHLVPALLRGRLNGVRTILWGHGVGKRETALRRRTRHGLLALSDACVLYSPGVAELLVREGQSKDRVFVAPNSLDLAPVRAAKSAWTPDRVDAFLASNDCTRGEVVVFVSRLEAWKRVDWLLEAFVHVASHRPLARCVIIGDGPERKRLEMLSERLGIAARVRFVGAIYDESTLAPWMLGGSCLAFPAAIGLSLLHAFAYGLPVVTSDQRMPHGPEIEALKNGVNGRLYADGDIGALTAAIEDLLGDSPERSRMSAAALATVEDVGGWNIASMVDGFVAAVTPRVVG